MSYTIVPVNGFGSAIVNLNASPSVRATAGGFGGAYDPFVIEDYALAPVNMPTTDFLPLVRIPVNAIVKKVELTFDIAPSTSLTGSLGLTFSNGGQGAITGVATGAQGVPDGTPPVLASTYALSAATPSIVSQSCFLHATNIVGATSWTDYTFSNSTGAGVTDGFYTKPASNQPMWQALTVGGLAGLGKASSGTGASAFASCQNNPGGFFDVCWFETTTGVNTSAVNLFCRVTYVLAK